MDRTEETSRPVPLPLLARRAAVLVSLALAACGGGGGGGPPSLQTLPPPALTQLSATVGSTAGGEPVTLTGTGFSPPVVVTFGAARVPVFAQSTTALPLNIGPS